MDINHDNDFTQIGFAFREKFGEDTTHINRFYTDADGTGDLRSVLDMVANFLREAGFSYVATIAAELDDGRVVFGDEA